MKTYIEDIIIPFIYSKYATNNRENRIPLQSSTLYPSRINVLHLWHDGDRHFLHSTPVFP